MAMCEGYGAKHMRAQAAEFPGYAGKFHCFLKGRVLQQLALIHLS